MDSTGVLVVIGTIVGTLVLCGIVAWIVLANLKKQAYSGTVVRKFSEEHESADDGTYWSYHLVLKTEDGQQKSVTIGKKLWDSFKEGDKIVKEAGKFNPSKA